MDQACPRRGTLDARVALFALALALLPVTALAGSTPGEIPFKSRELQPGRKFSQLLLAAPGVSESSGQLTHSYPIEIPAGRGVTPNLSLEYSSSAGFSEFGYGWDLTIPTIERSQRNGVADYTKDLYRFKNGHSISELLPTGVTTAGGGVEYRERVERSFHRYLRYGNRWTIQTQSGVRYELGSANASRRGKNVNLGVPGTAAWLVDRIIDANNNYALYEYENDLAANPQIRWVKYNGNAGTNLLPGMTVEFVWETHFGASAAVPAFRSGYRRLFGDRRLSAVVLRVPKHSGNTSTLTPETRTTRFTYLTPTASVDRAFYLQSAGIDGFPVTQFEYAQAPTGGQTLTLPVVGLPVAPNFPNLLGKQVPASGGQKTTITIADTTGDSRPEVLAACLEDNTNWTIYTNGGTQLTRTTVLAPWDTLTPGHLPDPCAIRVSIPTQTGDLTVQDFLDLDGDGFPDVVYVDGTIMYYCKGNGSGFEACTAYSGGVPAALREADSSSIPGATLTIQDLVDFNGDGRVDILRSSSGALQVYFNKGILPTGPLGFAPPVNFALPACPLVGGPRCLRATELVVVNQNNRRLMRAELRDINGDGLPDYVTSEHLSDQQPLALFVAYGTGGEFESAQSLDVSFPVGEGLQSGADYRAITDLVDVNGDGLPEIVVTDGLGAGLKVVFNNGGRWDTATGMTFFVPAQGVHAPGALVQQIANGQDVLTQSMFVDFTGDGIPDFVSVRIDGIPVPTVQVVQTNYSAPRRLIAIRSLNGKNITSINYQAEPDAKHVPVHVVSALTRSREALYPGEPARNTSFQTTYQYGSGYYDPAERSFMGFGTVSAIGPSWATTSFTVYHTDLPEQGLVSARTLVNNQAAGTNWFSSNNYTVLQLGTDRTFARLDRSDSTPDFTHLTYTIYSSYDNLGNPTSWTEGPANDIVFTRAFALSQDDSFTRNLVTEAYSTELGTQGSRTRLYYDTHGNVYRVERERDPNVFVARQYFYDGDGNIFRELDELNYATSHFYDATYHLYRTSSSNSLGLTTATFHALNGVPAEQCDVQTSGGTKRCSRTEVDVLGRPIESWVPTLVGGVYSQARLSTTTYTDIIYPLQTLVVKRGVSRSLEYTDGFGNPTEVRVEETSGQFRVWESSYDATGKPLRQEMARREASASYTHSGGGEAWLYDHDYANGSIEKVTFPRDSTSAPFATATRIDSGFQIVSTDEDQLVTRYYLDGHRRLTSIVRSKNGTAAATSFTRDGRGFVTEVTDPSNLTTRYGRSMLGWIYGVLRPDGQGDSRNYNDRGQIGTFTDPRIVRLTYFYDSPGRLVRIQSGSEPLGVRPVDATVSYYDATSPAQRGWKKNEVSDGITQSYTYNAEGLVKTRTTQFGSHTGSMEFDYLLGGALLSADYPDGESALFRYNLDDSIRTVEEDGDSYASYLYDDEGKVSVVNNIFGLDESYTYDARGRLVALSSTNTSVPGGDLVDDSLTLSPGSLVTRLDRRGLRPGLVPRTTADVDTISYDNLSRVSAVSRNGIGIAAYSYDLSGKLNDFRDTPQITSSSSTYSFDRLTQRTLTSSTQGSITDTFAYDLAGNVIADNRSNASGLGRMRAHQWDALGRYTRSSVDAVDNSHDGTTEYFYSMASELTRVIAPGEGLVPDDDLYIGKWARVNMTTGVWTNSVLANGTLVFNSIGARAEFPHRTIQNTVAAVSNDLGQVIRQEEFTPYGARAAGNGSGMIEEHFQGIRSDELTLAGSRTYDPASGIWLGRDSLVLSSPDPVLGETRLAAMYAFDFGSPYSLRDPSGQQPELGSGLPSVGGIIDAEWRGMKATATDVTTAGAYVGIGLAIAAVTLFPGGAFAAGAAGVGAGGAGATVGAAILSSGGLGGSLFNAILAVGVAGSLSKGCSSDPPPPPTGHPTGPVLNIGGEGEVRGAWNLNSLDAPLRSLEAIRQGGPLIVGDMQQMPFAANTFSAIVGNRLPFEAGFATRTAAEAYRVLQPGGSIKLFSSSGGGSGWIEPLKAAGFTDVRIEKGYAIGTKLKEP